MAAKISNPKPPKVEELESLRRTIETMDSLAQEGLSHIAAVARLALIALQTPDGHRDTMAIVGALHAIWAMAGEIEAGVTAEAAEVGCAHVDLDYFVRQSAQHAFHGGLKVRP